METKIILSLLSYRISFYTRHFIYSFLSKFFDKQSLNQSVMCPFRIKLEKKLSRALKALPKPAEATRIQNAEDFINPKTIRSLTEPIVIEQGCKRWPAQEKWDFDYLKKEHGFIMLRGAKNQKDNTRVDLTLKEALERIHDANPAFTNFEPLVETTSELKRDLNLSLLSPLVNRNPKFRFYCITFLGPKGYCSRLHMDVSNNFLINIRGKREVLLYSHDQTPLLYGSPEIPTHGYSYFSEIPPRQIFEFNELVKFPLFKYAKPVVTTLNAGDILYIPAFTWHVVKYLEDCIGVAAGFRNLPQAFKTSPFFTLLSSRKYIETFFLK